MTPPACPGWRRFFTPVDNPVESWLATRDKSGPYFHQTFPLYFGVLINM
jgi:hypothetical protein